MQPGIRVVVSVAGAVACIALLGVTPAPVLTTPLLIAGILAAAVSFWRGIDALADELDEEHGPIDDPAELWGVAGWPVPTRTDMSVPTRAERRQLISEIEEYLANRDDG